MPLHLAECHVDHMFLLRISLLMCVRERGADRSGMRAREKDVVLIRACLRSALRDGSTWCLTMSSSWLRRYSTRVARVMCHVPCVVLALGACAASRGRRQRERVLCGACAACEQDPRGNVQAFVILGAFLFCALLFFLMCPQSVLEVEFVKQVSAPPSLHCPPHPL